jgi:hypothetical protein
MILGTLNHAYYNNNQTTVNFGDYFGHPEFLTMPDTRTKDNINTEIIQAMYADFFIISKQYRNKHCMHTITWQNFQLHICFITKHVAETLFMTSVSVASRRSTI